MNVKWHRRQAGFWDHSGAEFGRSKTQDPAARRRRLAVYHPPRSRPAAVWTLSIPPCTRCLNSMRGALIISLASSEREKSREWGKNWVNRYTCGRNILGFETFLASTLFLASIPWTMCEQGYRLSLTSISYFPRTCYIGVIFDIHWDIFPSSRHLNCLCSDMWRNKKQI